MRCKTKIEEGDMGARIESKTYSKRGISSIFYINKVFYSKYASSLACFKILPSLIQELQHSLAKAYVLMNCDLGSEKEVVASLKEIDGVKEAHGTFGLYDIVAQLESDTGEKIQEIVINTIRKMNKINSTVTLTRSESGEIFQASEKLIGMMLGQNTAQAYVVIHCDKGQEYPTLKNLSHVPEVKEADVVFGLYDVICKIDAPDDITLQNVITKAIRTLPDIKTSMTLSIIKEQESS